jgi:hypothetical protein
MKRILEIEMAFAALIGMGVTMIAISIWAC